MSKLQRGLVESGHFVLGTERHAYLGRRNHGTLSICLKQALMVGGDMLKHLWP
jgi:hypothetical protein